MKLIIFVVTAFCIQCIVADSLERLLPQLTTAFSNIAKDDFSAAKELGKYDIKKIMAIIHKETPTILAKSKGFTDVAKQIHNMVKAIENTQKTEGSKGVFSNVSKNLLRRLEGTMTNMAQLFKKVGPGIVQYVSDLNDAITPYSLTKNGYLKLPRSFIRRTEGIENNLSTTHFAISNDILLASSELEDINNELNKSNIQSELPSELLEKLEPILGLLSNAYMTVGSDIRQLILNLKQIRSVYKNTRKGTCVYVPVRKFTHTVANSYNSIADAYSHIGQLNDNIVAQIQALSKYLQTMV